MTILCGVAKQKIYSLSHDYHGIYDYLHSLARYDIVSKVSTDTSHRRSFSYDLASTGSNATNDFLGAERKAKSGYRATGSINLRMKIFDT